MPLALRWTRLSSPAHADQLARVGESEGVGVGSTTDLGRPAVAFTGLEPSSPLAGIGGMSESPAGSSKRGDYP